MDTHESTLFISSEWCDGYAPARRYLIITGILVSLIFLIGVTNKWWPTPDSALYLSLGRSLAEGNGYYFNGSPCNIVTPGLPLILAGLRILFGDGFWAPNLFEALCGLIALLFVYLVVSRISNRFIALICVLGVGLSFTFYYQTHRILTDAPFAAIFWMLLYSWYRYRDGSAGWLIIIGLLTAVGLFIRAPGALILIPLVALVLERTSGKSNRQGLLARKGLLAAATILFIVFTEISVFYWLARKYASGTPLYAQAAFSRFSSGIRASLFRIGEGLAHVPFVLTEMFTSQDGLFLVILVGLPILIIGGIGGAILWKRGHRFVLPVIVLCILGLAISGGFGAIRSRYLLPIQPLLFLVVIEGLCWCIWKFYQRKGKDVSSPTYRKVVMVFVFLVVISNAPKVLRNAVYYSYLSHTRRYYEVIRSGEYAEVFEIAHMLRESGDKGLIAADASERSILHFLSGKIVLDLPTVENKERRNLAHAERLYKDFLASHKNIGFIVVHCSNDSDTRSAIFNKRLVELLDNDPHWKICYNGKRYRVYQFVSTQ